MRNTLNNTGTTDRATFHNVDELLQKIDEGEMDYREGRIEDAFEWLARVKAEHIQKTEILPVPERLIVRSEEELLQKLEEARKDIEAGRVEDAFVFMERIKNKYGFN